MERVLFAKDNRLDTDLPCIIITDIIADHHHRRQLRSLASFLPPRFLINNLNRMRDIVTPSRIPDQGIPWQVSNCLGGWFKCFIFPRPGNR